jgi:hypothetical protein
MASQVQLTGGSFQDSEGYLLSGGYLTFRLNQDANVNDSQICAGITVKVNLDGYGSIIGGQYIWGNDVLSPANSYYTVTGYSSNGQISWGPNNQQVTGSSPFDVGTWVPNQVVSWTPSVQALALQTNEVANGSQALLDLHAGTNITLTDNGSGRVTIAASGGGSLAAGTTVCPLVAEPIISPTGVSSGGSRTWFTRVPGKCMTAFPSTWTITFSIASGTPGVFSGFCVYRTLNNSVVVVDRTDIKFGGVTNPTFNLTGDQVSDTVSLALDPNHDYWFMWYDATGALTINTLATNSGLLVEGGEYNGNLTTYIAGNSISTATAVFNKTPLLGWQAV